MSKKHKKHENQDSGMSFSQNELMEYAVIKRDLIKVAILSLIFFGLILVLFYGFHKNGKLESWFSSFLYF